jgi:dihydrofolate reductase
MAYSIEEALRHCDPDEECFVIGGGMIYRQFMDIADKLYITLVHKEFEADTFYPEIDPETWKEVEREEGLDENLEFTYSFITYLRRE